MPTINTGRITPGTGEVNYRDEMLPGGANISSSEEATANSNVLTVKGRNLGIDSDLGLYLRATGTDEIILDFKSLRAGPGIGLTSVADSILIYNNRVITNAGTGIGMVLGDFGSETRIASLRGEDGITVALDGSDLVVGVSSELAVVAGIGLEKVGPTISIVASGAVPGTYDLPQVTVDITGRITAISSAAVANVGGGHAIYAGRALNHDLQFRSLVAGPGLELTSAADTITVGIEAVSVEPGVYSLASISVDAAGRVTMASSNALGGENVGAGAGLFAGMDGTTHRFKTITAGTGIVVTDGTDDITIATDGGVVSVTAGDGLVGGTITEAGTIALGDTGVAPGEYSFATVTVDRHGRVVQAQSNSEIVATKLQAPRSITLAGKVTGTGVFDGTSDITIPTALAISANDVTAALGYGPARTDIPQLFTGQQNSAMVMLSGPAVAWNLNQSNVFKLILDADAAMTITDGLVAGGTYVLIVEQASPGGHAITWDAAIKWPSGVVFQPSPEPGTWSIFSFVSDGVRLFATAVPNYYA